jgi:hypothetical protein
MCERHRCRVKRTIALEASQCENAFDCGCPPHEHCGLPRGKRLQPPSRLFGNQQRHNLGPPPFSSMNAMPAADSKARPSLSIASSETRGAKIGFNPFDRG